MMKKLMKTIPFLKSLRFWQLVIVVTLYTLQAHGVIPENAWAMLAEIVQIVLGTSVVIRTVDKVSESKKK